jgi:glycosyltransferase involved in cell wall biosynthesis
MKYEKCQGGYEFVFWVYDLNVHFTEFVAALKLTKSVLVVAEKEIDGNRIGHGLNTDEAITDDLIFLPSNQEIEEIILTNRHAIHVFYGMLAFNVPKRAFKFAVAKKVKLGVFQESGLYWGWKKYFTKLKTLYCSVFFKDSIQFILPMGNLGVNWFLNNNFSKKNIYPFLYSPKFTSCTFDTEPSERTVNITIVSQLIKRKNIELVINALSQIHIGGWKLSIIGDGDMKSKLKQLVSKLQLNDRVEFLGVVPNQEIFHVLKKTDFTVLPSNWDGWGAVVNESLYYGVPVICSDTCGSSCLVNATSNRGEIFKSGDLNSLTICLHKWIMKGKLEIKTRNEIISWTSCIQPQNVAQYFLEIMDSVYNQDYSERPVSIWESN